MVSVAARCSSATREAVAVHAVAGKAVARVVADKAADHADNGRTLSDQ